MKSSGGGWLGGQALARKLVTLAQIGFETVEA
jgi:hypothetical protein